MQLHTVQKDESLYNIARKYSIPATKILADNDLPGDRLTTGDMLVILTPTKTVTVRGGDTLDSISKRFGVRKSSVIRDNPALFGKDKLRPGQILTVKQDEAKIGVGSALGYVTKGCRRDKLTKALPYLTYTTVCSAVIKGESVLTTFDAKSIIETVKSQGKIAILGIEDLTHGDFLLTEESYSKVILEAINIAREMNFMGVSISAKEGSEKYPERYCEFLLLGRKKLIGCNMILFTEIYENTPTDASELCDGAVLNTELNSIDGTIKALRNFSERAESSKVFVKLKTDAKIGDGSISADEIKELCYRSGKELTTDNKSQISSFSYVKYRIGKGEENILSFPSLKYIKAKLEALCELGFMGIGCDIDTVPMANLTMFNSMFARADYSLM